jgi:hypothetical protein
VGHGTGLLRVNSIDSSPSTAPTDGVREEKASIATGSNLPFSEWGSIIPDPRLVAAIVDRLTFHAHIN